MALPASTAAASPPTTLSVKTARAVINADGRHLFEIFASKAEGLIAPTRFRSPYSRACTRMSKHEIWCTFALIWTGLPHGEAQTCDYEDHVRKVNGQTTGRAVLLNCETQYPVGQ
jgi:hypothetical protein